MNIKRIDWNVSGESVPSYCAIVMTAPTDTLDQCDINNLKQAFGGCAVITADGSKRAFGSCAVITADGLKRAFENCPPDLFAAEWAELYKALKSHKGATRGNNMFFLMYTYYEGDSNLVDMFIACSESMQMLVDIAVASKADSIAYPGESVPDDGYYGDTRVRFRITQSHIRDGVYRNCWDSAQPSTPPCCPPHSSQT